MKRSFSFIVAFYVFSVISCYSQNLSTFNFELAQNRFTHEKVNHETDSTGDYKDLTFISCIPNPASDLTHFKFYLPEKTTIEINIFNTSGQKVLDVLKNMSFDEGINETPDIDLKKLSIGTYECRITASNKSVSKSLVIVR
jgi:hypothetical protein